MADYVRAITFVRNRQWLYRYSPLIGGVSIFLVVFLILISLRDPSDVINPIILVLGSLFPALSVAALLYGLSRFVNPLFLRHSIKGQVDGSPLLQEVNEIELSDAGITGTTFLGGGSTKWAAVTQVIESDTDFYFFTSPKFSIFIPKCAFADNAEVEQVRALIQERVRERAQLMEEEAKL